MQLFVLGSADLPDMEPNKVLVVRKSNTQDSNLRISVI